MSELRIGRVQAIAGVTLIPIERVTLNGWGTTSFGGCWAEKGPAAVVICVSGTIRAVDASGRDFDLEDLISRVPALDALIRKLCGPGV